MEESSFYDFSKRGRIQKLNLSGVEKSPATLLGPPGAGELSDDEFIEKIRKIHCNDLFVIRKNNSLSALVLV
jgi:hypothetical protein